MRKLYPSNPFERYADDLVIHCKTEEEAKALLDAIKKRFQECKLELHPDKTKIVYCKDSNRKGNGQNEKFDFLGYTFRPRSSRNRYGKLFTNFSPAMSDKAKQKVRDVIKGWKKEIKSDATLENFVKVINPVVAGWINYYGKFFESELWSTMKYIDTILMMWAKKKYDKLRRNWRKVSNWFSQIKKRATNLFKHWQWMQKHDLDRRAV